VVAEAQAPSRLRVALVVGQGGVAPPNFVVELRAAERDLLGSECRRCVEFRPRAVDALHLRPNACRRVRQRLRRRRALRRDLHDAPGGREARVVLRRRRVVVPAKRANRACKVAFIALCVPPGPGKVGAVRCPSVVESFIDVATWVGAHL
jgi:hypothetical protein